jgi:hypothetical protein
LLERVARAKLIFGRTLVADEGGEDVDRRGRESERERERGGGERQMTGQRETNACAPAHTW